MLGYTLAQFEAFTVAAARAERRRAADLLFLIRAAQAEQADYRRVEKALRDG